MGVVTRLDVGVLFGLFAVVFAALKHEMKEVLSIFAGGGVSIVITCMHLFGHNIQIFLMLFLAIVRHLPGLLFYPHQSKLICFDKSSSQAKVFL